MSCCDAAAVTIQHTDAERRIGRHLYHDRAIRLYHRVSDDLFHAKCTTRPERSVVDIKEIVIGNVKLRSRGEADIFAVKYGADGEPAVTLDSTSRLRRNYEHHLPFYEKLRKHRLARVKPEVR